MVPIRIVRGVRVVVSDGVVPWSHGVRTRTFRGARRDGRLCRGFRPGLAGLGHELVRHGRAEQLEQRHGAGVGDRPVCLLGCLSGRGPAAEGVGFPEPQAGVAFVGGRLAAAQSCLAFVQFAAAFVVFLDAAGLHVGVVGFLVQEFLALAEDVGLVGLGLPEELPGAGRVLVGLGHDGAGLFPCGLEHLVPFRTGAVQYLARLAAGVLQDRVPLRFGDGRDRLGRVRRVGAVHFCQATAEELFRVRHLVVLPVDAPCGELLPQVGPLEQFQRVSVLFGHFVALGEPPADLGAPQLGEEQDRVVQQGAGGVPVGAVDEWRAGVHRGAGTDGVAVEVLDLYFAVDVLGGRAVLVDHAVEVLPPVLFRMVDQDDDVLAHRQVLLLPAVRDDMYLHILRPEGLLEFHSCSPFRGERAAGMAKPRSP